MYIGKTFDKPKTIQQIVVDPYTSGLMCEADVNVHSKLNAKLWCGSRFRSTDASTKTQLGPTRDFKFIGVPNSGGRDPHTKGTWILSWNGASETMPVCKAIWLEVDQVTSTSSGSLCGIKYFKIYEYIGNDVGLIWGKDKYDTSNVYKKEAPTLLEQPNWIPQLSGAYNIPLPPLDRPAHTSSLITKLMPTIESLYQDVAETLVGDYVSSDSHYFGGRLDGDPSKFINMAHVFDQDLTTGETSTTNELMCTTSAVTPNQDPCPTGTAIKDSASCLAMGVTLGHAAGTADDHGATHVPFCFVRTSDDKVFYNTNAGATVEDVGYHSVCYGINLDVHSANNGILIGRRFNEDQPFRQIIISSNPLQRPLVTHPIGVSHFNVTFNDVDDTKEWEGVYPTNLD
jgi:hypothetical protein